MSSIPKELPYGTLVCMKEESCFTYNGYHLARHHQRGVMPIEEWLAMAWQADLSGLSGSLWFATANYYRSESIPVSSLLIKGRCSVPYWVTHVQWHPAI